MAETFNSSSFAPFLEGVKQAFLSSVPMASAPMGILKILVEEPKGELALSRLLWRTGMNLDTLAGMARELEKAGLITQLNEGSERAIALTPTGKDVALLQF